MSSQDGQLTPQYHQLLLDFGPGSQPMAEAVSCLSDLYQENSAAPPVVGAFEYWRQYRESPACGGPASPTIFVEHTYLALLTRLVVYHRLRPPRAPVSIEELWKVVNGDWFVGLALENFLSEDFFTWPFFRRSMGLAADNEALDVIRKLSGELVRFNLVEASSYLLTELFHKIALSAEAPIQTLPRWLAEYLLEEELGLAQQPEQTLLDPSCNSGTFLAAAVGLKVDALRAHGDDPSDILLKVTAQVAGMAPDPLAATVSKASYLLALGDLPKEPHPPILVPVYLADVGHGSGVASDSAGVTVHSFPMVQDLSLPSRVAEDPMMLDWLFGRLPNYMKGAATRLLAQPEEVAVQEVLNAYYNYLTSPKSRTPIPEALTPAAADVMVETAKHLIQGYLRGDGQVRLFMVKNAAAPFFLARRQFDLLVGSHTEKNPIAAFAFSDCCQSAYLCDTGRAAVVSVPDSAEPSRYEYKLAGSGQPINGSKRNLRFTGDLPITNARWAEIKDQKMIEVHNG